MQSVSTSHGAVQVKRVDARRNQEKVVAAAEQLFAESGLDVSIDDIAHRAGVGKATVYRSFPTKDHLVAVIAAERLATFERMLGEALDENDAGNAFRRVLVGMARANARDRVMLGALRAGVEEPELSEARAAVLAGLDRLMRRAKRQGSIRRDAKAEDVRNLLSGLTFTLTCDQQRDPAVWARYANLVADALGA